MARPREFDPDTALERAMQLFWSKGYEATSLDDLCEATGLSRSSLYAAFGDKRALLLRSLERYEARIDSFVGGNLDRPVPIREAMEAFIDDLIDRIVAGPGRRGCFLGNCAAEFARSDGEAVARVRHGLARIEETFTTAFDRAKARGEIAAGADTRALARFFLASVQGLRLVGKANPDRDALEDVKRVMLTCLDR
jgi:TetR/AcrR family transcriptional repressor of nem operon